LLARARRNKGNRNRNSYHSFHFSEFVLGREKDFEGKEEGEIGVNSLVAADASFSGYVQRGKSEGGEKWKERKGRLPSIGCPEDTEEGGSRERKRGGGRGRIRRSEQSVYLFRKPARERVRGGGKRGEEKKKKKKDEGDRNTNVVLLKY